jgi:hypothetical protein
LFLSRDRLGVRPLFYTICGDQLLFASEIKALFAHPAVSREIDRRSLDNIFTFWTTLAPRTAFNAIRELPPGHSLTWHDDKISVTEHWRPTFPRTQPVAPSETSSIEALQTVLEDATRIRLRSDVPVGAYLSGGLDSSLIVALTKRVSDVPLRTFSIGFDNPHFDESAYQRAGRQSAAHRPSRDTLLGRGHRTRVSRRRVARRDAAAPDRAGPTFSVVAIGQGERLQGRVDRRRRRRGVRGLRHLQRSQDPTLLVEVPIVDASRISGEAALPVSARPAPPAVRLPAGVLSGRA